jgi:hypothetical protein
MFILSPYFYCLPIYKRQYVYSSGQFVNGGDAKDDDDKIRGNSVGLVASLMNGTIKNTN